MAILEAVQTKYIDIQETQRICNPKVCIERIWLYQINNLNGSIMRDRHSAAKCKFSGITYVWLI